MRFVTAVLCVLIAGPALAAAPVSLRVVKTSPDAAGLRGAQSASTAASPAAATPASTPLPPSIQSKAPLSFYAASAQPAPRVAGECRQACAHSYYFCLAGGDAPSCPQQWTSCRSDCNRDSRPLP
jgi:hypothetical protein